MPEQMKKRMKQSNELATKTALKTKNMLLVAGAFAFFSLLSLLIWIAMQTGNPTDALGAGSGSPPENDLKADAIWLTDLYEDQSAFAAYRNSFATADAQNASCISAGTAHGVWFKFQALYSDATIIIKTGGAQGSIRNVEAALLDTNDNEITCSAATAGGDATLTTTALVQDEWYYILVNTASTTDTGTFTLYINNVSPVKYYVRNSGDWDNTNSWSTTGYSGSAAGSLPTKENVVFIRQVDKTIKVDGITAECAGIVMTGGNKETTLKVENSGILNVYGKCFAESADNKEMKLEIKNANFYVQDSLVVHQNGGSKKIEVKFDGGDVEINRSAEFKILDGDKLELDIKNSSVVDFKEDWIFSRTGGNDDEDLTVRSSTVTVGGDARFLMEGGTGSNAKMDIVFKSISDITVQGDFVVEESAGSEALTMDFGKNNDPNERAELLVYGDFKFGANNGGSTDMRVDIAVFESCVIEVKGNVEHTTTKGRFDFVKSSALLKLSGSGKQYVTGEKTGLADIEFQNILVDNSFTNIPDSIPGVYLQGPIELEQQLELLDGIVKTSNTKLITLAAGAALVGGSDTAFVDGPFKRYGGSDFTFPIGNRGVYAPLGVSNFSNTGSSHSFQAQYFYTGYSDTTTDITLNKVSQVEYWNLQRTSGTADVAVTLHWRDGARSGISDLNDLALAWYSSSYWTSIAPVTVSGTVNQGSISSNNRQNTFGNYTFGSLSGGNILPITLSWFDARARNGEVHLNWATEMEHNNDYFVIERSQNGIDFEELAQVKGAGNSDALREYSYIDDDPYTGVSYYRLKQVDYDGQYEYFNMVEVYIEPKTKTEEAFIIENIYPNPAIDHITLNVLSQKEEEGVVEIIDLSGRTLYKKSIDLSEGSNEINIPLAQDLPASSYIVSLQTKDGMISRQFIKSR